MGTIKLPLYTATATKDDTIVEGQLYSKELFVQGKITTVWFIKYNKNISGYENGVQKTNNWDVREVEIDVNTLKQTSEQEIKIA